ncbi:hypothetical protein [Rhodovastum atsumiense]|uniref:Uncharacterized protein n=1 Tax=Rhodovastum atsumiense TaxID=504468 RepID=A0A5M6ITE1_9PROT|nr:hypothetical protein [Rhodovastum atsumiense]KAA5611586.1 hypothetical protein F1189_13560 [Rhodovastum atsumiense]
MVLAEMRRDRLLAVSQNLFPDVETSDDYLWGKLLSAEAQASKALRTFLTPREVVPQDTPEAEIQALRDAGEAVVPEPGYDFDPALFSAGTWGALRLRHRPVIKVHGLKFVYPGTENPIFDVPVQWLRLDRKYGVAQFVPVGTYMQGQLGGFVLSAIGFASAMPLSIQVRYRAGLKNAAEEHPDLLDVVKKMAVLGVVEDQFFPASGSVSADGLSQSLSMDTSKYEDIIEKKLARLRQLIGGVVMGRL